MKANTTVSQILASLALAGFATAGTATMSGKAVPVKEIEQPSPLSTTLTVGYASSYEYRGFDIGDNLVNIDLTSTYTISDQASVFAGVWYGTLFDGDYNEIDLTGGINYDFGFINSTLLYRHYFYDNDIADNNEVGIILSTDAMFGADGKGLVFALGTYYDFEFEGWYSELSGAYTGALTDTIGYQLSAGVSYVYDYILEDNGWNHAFVQLSLPIALYDNVTLTPFVRGVFPTDVLDDAGGDDLVIGGASLAVSF